MKLSKALKLKNRKVKEINTLLQRIRENNSYNVKNPAKYDSRALLVEYNAAKDDLIKLKTAIMITNQPVYHKIFRLAEIKGNVQQFAYLATTEGEFGAGENAQTHVAVIGAIERDEMVKKWEDEIEKIQDELEEFNAITNLKGYTEPGDDMM